MVDTNHASLQSIPPGELQKICARGDEFDEPAAKRRKPKASTLRDKDWEPYKDRITELYSQPRTDLRSVQTIIKNEYGFKAE
jgi:hypothetical protein